MALLPLTSPLAPERPMPHPGITWFSPSLHIKKTLQNIWKTSLHSQSLSSLTTQSLLSTFIQNLHVVHGDIISGSLLIHSHTKKGLSTLLCRSWKGKNLQRGHTTGTAWEQFCRGAREEEPNLPMQTALCCSNLDYAHSCIIVEYSFSFTTKTASLKCCLSQNRYKQQNACVYINIVNITSVECLNLCVRS